jgi:outer membrane protein assembly factor BamD (BamD/ComL family)
MIRGWHGVVLLTVLIAGPLSAQPAPAGPASQPSARLEANPTLDRSESLLKAGNWKAAHDLLVPWLKANPKAPDRDRGVFLLAEVYYVNGDRVRAFYHCDELMDNFPESRLFFPALELQYDIADAYLNGYKDAILGLRIVPMTDEAIEMLFRIQERSPGSPVAERALKRTADYYFNTSQFDLAAVAYGAFARSYPRSPDVPQVRLRQAFSSLAQFRGPRFDSTPLIDARAQFRELQARYPDLAADANLAGWIDRIDADLARKAYVKGDFYARTHQLKGAAYMFRYVIETYPNSHEATLARAALAKLPPSALTGPPPPPSNPEAAAATQPVGAGAAPGESERRP